MFKTEKLVCTLHQLIEQGVWRANQKLPSLREQAQISGYSLMTVMNAYRELEAQGIIYAKQKSGYYLAQPPTSPAEQHATAIVQTDVSINALLFNYLKSTQKHEILPFGSAFPNESLLLPPKLIQIMAQQARHSAHYSSTDSMPPGLLDLRHCIARRYSLQGLPTKAMDIVITSGGLNALNLALEAVAQNGDYILLQETIFYGAWQAAERLGLNVITLAEHAKHGFDLEGFERCLKQYPIKVCWLMLNSHNPIGFTVNADIKGKIIHLLEKYHVYLIEDDVYQELYYGTQKPVAIKQFDQHDLVVHCGSFSKTLGSTFRVGWVYNRTLSHKIQHLQLMNTIAVSPLIQHALVAFLSSHHYEKHLRQLRRLLERYKKQFYSYLKHNLPQHSEVYYYPTGYFLWIKLPKQMNSMQLYETLLGKNISITPSPLFNFNPQQQHFIRINCSFAWSEAIEHGLSELVLAINAATD